MGTTRHVEAATPPTGLRSLCPQKPSKQPSAPKHGPPRRHRRNDPTKALPIISVFVPEFSTTSRILYKMVKSKLLFYRTVYEMQTLCIVCIRLSTKAFPFSPAFKILSLFASIHVTFSAAERDI